MLLSFLKSFIFLGSQCFIIASYDFVNKFVFLRQLSVILCEMCSGIAYVVARNLMKFFVGN